MMISSLTSSFLGIWMQWLRSPSHKATDILLYPGKRWQGGQGRFRQLKGWCFDI
jgi:hypothetical protein